jgi:hypothetical protein
MIQSSHPSLKTPSATPAELDEFLAEALALAERINQRLGLQPAGAAATREERVAAGRAQVPADQP